jgi:glycosyltransferase involved in cell wall biosynthesis
MGKQLYNNCLCSVIIPTYNRADYLKIAIDSVLAQTYIFFELLILDNCSTDHTANMISSYTDPRIKSIRHQANIGVIPNWYYGMHWAAGEYFSILGDDDYYRPNFLESRVNALNNFPKALAAFSDQEECDAEGNQIQINRLFKYKEQTLIQGQEIFDAIHNKNRIWSIGSGLFRKNPVVVWWDDCVYAGKSFDTALQVQIAMKGTVVVIPDRGLVYRRHSGQDYQSDVFIGHLLSYFEPLFFQDSQRVTAKLVEGAEWALPILVSKYLKNKNYFQARRLLAIGILYCPFSLRYLAHWSILGLPRPLVDIVYRFINWLRNT